MTMLSHFELIFRILFGAIMGGLIGFERGQHGHQAGLRTHLIVALASATFMTVSTQFGYHQFGADWPKGLDPSRIAASVVMGIGFLAGGAIFKTGMTIQGLTTAASLWLVTAIGLAAGAGMFAESAAVTVLGLGSLTLLHRFEEKSERQIEHRIFVVFNGDEEALCDELALALRRIEVCVTEIRLEKKMEQATTAVTYDVRAPKRIGIPQMSREIRKLPAVAEYRVESIG